MAVPPRALYIHVPFCSSTCPYCDFSSITVHDRIGDYVDALCAELRTQAGAALVLDTVFLGGGTPSLLSRDHIGAVLGTVRDAFALAPDYEWTIEANPGTASLPKAIAWRRGGVNRVSIGAQSFDMDILHALGRHHTPEAIVRAADAVRTAGITNLNLDLMYGVPGQTLETLDATLDAALALGPEHISAYQLTIEPDTPFASAEAAGTLDLPDDDTALEQRALVERRLAAAGLEAYEISNYARAGFACRHNLVYWRQQPYLGCGVSAVGFDGCTRSRNLSGVDEYIAAIAGTGRAVAERETLDSATLAFEEIFNGLRLRQGLCVDRFPAESLTEVARLRRGGFLEEAAGCVRLTERGIPVANEVVLRFLR